MNRFNVIRCFGRFTAELEHSAVLPRHASALLAVLATRGERPTSRPEMADLLWDGMELSKKRHSLSQTLYSIRKIATDAIICSTTHVSLHPETRCDTSDFQLAVRDGDYHRALELYDGAFLDGFEYITDAFDDWRIAKGAHYEDAAVIACTEVISVATIVEDYAAVAEAAKRGLLIRPLDEAFARARVEALASLGDSPRALREFDSYRKRILTETGAYPNQLSDSLAESIARMPLGVSPVTPPGAPTRLVGRSDELAQIRAHLNSVPRSSRIVLIQGEPGIGKTRVLQHAMRRAAIEGARVYMYICAEAESRLPNSGIVGLLRDGFRRQDLDLLEPGSANVLGALMPELFGHAKPAHNPERLLWEAAAQYFRAIAASGSVALAIDDLHWLDSSSLDVITYVLKRNAQLRLLFIGAGRPPLQSPVYEDDRPLTAVIHLKELSAHAVGELISEFERINSVEVSGVVRRMLADRVGGRPFFLLQALSHLQRHGGDFPGDDLLPPNVAIYIIRRVSSLPVDARHVAQAMAVFNRAVPIHLLAAAAQLSVVAVSRALDELVTNGIVADQPTPRFTHDLVKQAVLQSLPEPVITAWHARIAAAFGSGSAESDGVAAYHYECAGDYESAYQRAVRAADVSYHAAEYRMCSDHYARAVRCAPKSARIGVLAKYSVLLAKIGDFDALYPHLEELEAYFKTCGDGAGTTVCLLAHFTRAEASGGQGTEESVRKAKQILANAQRYFPDEIATVVWQVADAIRRSGELQLLAEFAVSLERQAANASTAHKAEMLAAASLLGGLTIGHNYAAALADEALSLSEKLPEGILTVRARFARGTAMLSAGNLHQAGIDFERALGIADAHAVGQISTSIKSNYSIVLVEQGNFVDAERMALESLREAGAPRRGYAFGNLATIKLRSGDWKGARHYAQALLDSHSTTPHSWIPAHVEALKGLADLGESDLTAAVNRIDTLDKLVPLADPLVDNSHIHLLYAGVDSRQGRTDAAISRLEGAIASSAVVDTLSTTRLQVELARILLAAGRHEQASRLINEVGERARNGAMLCLSTEIERLRLNG